MCVLNKSVRRYDMTQVEDDDRSVIFRLHRVSLTWGHDSYAVFIEAMLLKHDVILANCKGSISKNSVGLMFAWANHKYVRDINNENKYSIYIYI